LVQCGQRTFVRELEHQGIIDRVKRLHIELYGSLGATGKGHGTDKAVLLGLEGEAPELVDPSNIPQRLTATQFGYYNAIRYNLMKRPICCFSVRR
jgi:hypothetical protein